MVYPWGQGAADRGDIFFSKQNLATYTGSPFPFLFIFPPSISMHFIYPFGGSHLEGFFYVTLSHDHFFIVILSNFECNQAGGCWLNLMGHFLVAGWSDPHLGWFKYV